MTHLLAILMATPAQTAWDKFSPAFLSATGMVLAYLAVREAILQFFKNRRANSEPDESELGGVFKTITSLNTKLENMQNDIGTMKSQSAIQEERLKNLLKTHEELSKDFKELADRFYKYLLKH